MLKLFWTSIVFTMVIFNGYTQESLKIHVFSKENQKALADATIRLGGQAKATDAKGTATFEVPANQTLRIEVSLLGYRRQIQTLQPPYPNQISIGLDWESIHTDEVFVQGIRAKENSATTFSNVSKDEIAQNNLGQDVPYLLNQTPSMVVFSDAGAGVGYTGMRIRGSDNTRINVTIDGIPLNNPESMGSFFVNLPDFASSVENIQVQRGIGTSTNGAGAFGASLNIQSDRLQQNPYAEINNSFGSYNTWKNTVKAGTGLINNHFAFNARLSKISSDGYIDRAFSDLKSFYFDAGYYSEKQILKATVFSGKEKTYQAWNGVPEALLKENRRFNEFDYENQTDNYTQTHHYLHYTNFLNNHWTLNAALHYTKGAGYYEEFRENDKFGTYGMEPIIFNQDTIARTDLVRQRWLDNHFYGFTYGVNYSPSNDLTVNIGGGYNEYLGDHFGEVIWAKYSSNLKPGDQYYFNDAKKTDFNIYGKVSYQIEKVLLNMDLQYRNIYYRFLGFDHNMKPTDQDATHHFFNPKIGATYLLSDKSNIYLSYAYASKEPIRKDYTESTSNSRPKPESMHDIEAGYRIRDYNFNIGANAYGMLYKDQLIITGEINDVGSAIRQNVPDSYRIGLELDANWMITDRFSWSATAAFSKNRIKKFEEYLDIEGYDPQEKQQMITYSNTTIAMSPSVVVSNSFRYELSKDLQIALLSKYISRQYLDNTSSNERSISDFLVHDIHGSYSFSALGIKKIVATLAVNNLLNEKYVSNGYTWGYVDKADQRLSYNYYFPQATTNFLLGLNISF